MIEANPRASRTVPFVAKATGVPLAKVAARVMVGATLAELRDEGLLRPPVQRRPRRGEGGGAAVQPLPRRRHAARPGDALDRRGHGHRPHVRPGVRQEPDRGGRPAARAGHGVPLAGRPRQGRRRSWPPGASPSSASRIAATGGHRRRTSRRHGIPVDDAWSPSSASGDGRRRRRPDRRAARSTSWSTRPRGRGPRADGAHIRTRGRRAPASRASPPRRPALAAADGMADWAAPRACGCARLQEYHARHDRPARAADRCERVDAAPVAIDLATPRRVGRRCPTRS